MIELVWRPDVRSPELDDARAARNRLGAQGLRCFRLSDVGRGIEVRSSLYQLVRLGVLDTPGGEDDFVSFESFDAELFEPYYWRWADAQILAADGDLWVGLSNLQLRELERAEMGITVVRREYRRRGIARALKVIALSQARALGIVSVVTRNHPDNEPILRLNASLGFTRA
jgi:GNAT superfamily N-acetyltransferase